MAECKRIEFREYIQIYHDYTNERIREYYCLDEDNNRTPIEPDEILLQIFAKQVSCCEKLDKLEQEFQDFKAGYGWDVDWDWPGSFCDDDEYERLVGAGTGFRALVDLLSIHYQAIHKVGQEVCKIESSYSVPEHWQIPMEARRPQLIINIAPRLDDKKFEPAKWRVTIPHYTGNEDSPPPFEYIDKGKVQGTEILSDNSKIRCYAASVPEADRILDACLLWVNPLFAHESQRKYTMHEDSDLQEVRMYPRRGTFWTFGKKTGNPKWSMRYEIPRDNI